MVLQLFFARQVRSTKFCLFYMYVYLFYTFIRLMLLGLCSKHYFISVMNPVTFYNNNKIYSLLEPTRLKVSGTKCTKNKTELPTYIF